MLATANTGKIGRGLEKMQANGPEGQKKAWKKSLVVSVACTDVSDLLQALKGERLSSVFSPDGTLISASAAPHCGDLRTIAG